MTNEEIERFVEETLKKLTLKEKVSLLSGRDSWSTMPIPRLGIPELVMTDGPHGVRSNQPDAGRKVAGPTTAFPTGVSMASTWNPDLVEQAAHALGEETKAMGCDILLGPCVNIVRTPNAGRNFEAYSEDPYLAGKIGAAYVKGLQSAGAGASLKHFAANNQEDERFRGDSVVDERTLREIYLPHFERVVKEAQPWTVMCSYNRLNGEYASQNHHLLTEILKDEWGFKGIVVSDWTANHSTIESVEGGLDIEMPGPAKWYGALLEESVQNWVIEEEEVDKAARRVLRMVARSGKLDGTEKSGSVNTPEHQALARKVAEEAIVLLKNDGGLLPLQPEQLQTLAIIGPAAAEMAVSGGGSAYTEPPHRISPLKKLRETLGDQVEVRYEPGCDNWQDIPVMQAAYITPAQGSGQGLYGEYYSGTQLEGEPFLTRVDPRLDFFWFSSGPASGIGARFSVRWTGMLEVPQSGNYVIRVTNSGTSQLFIDDRQVLESLGEGRDMNDVANTAAVLKLEKDHPYRLRLEVINHPYAQFTNIRLGFAFEPDDSRLDRAVDLAREADVALVFVGDTEQWESEGFDRKDLKLPGRQNELVTAVAAVNPRTIVVLNVGAPVEMPWIDSVAAVVQGFFPGMEGGAAIEAVLSGAVNPSGKLTVTYPNRFEDTPAFNNLSYINNRQVRYGEGIFVGYRHYDRVAVEPLFPFGYGLSYTTFAYGELSAPDSVKPGETFTVSLPVTNTGKRAGKEVVQLYVGDPLSSLPRPVKELKGFAKVELAPGETKTVTFTLEPRDLSFYDVLKKDWVAEPGEFHLSVGASAEDIRSTANFLLEG